MSLVAGSPETSARTVLPSSEAVWDAIRVDACRALLAEWSQAKVHGKMKKAPAVTELVETGVSVDFPRVFRWRDEGVVDPGAQPQDGAQPREWALDRTFFLLMMDGKISAARLIEVGDLGLQPARDGDSQAAPPGPAEVLGVGSGAPVNSTLESASTATGGPSDGAAREHAEGGVPHAQPTAALGSSSSACTAPANPSGASAGVDVATVSTVNDATTSSANGASSSGQGAAGAASSAGARAFPSLGQQIAVAMAGPPKMVAREENASETSR